jgi:hypothetical protein
MAPMKGTSKTARMLSIVITDPMADEVNLKLTFKKMGTKALYTAHMPAMLKKPNPSKKTFP